MLVLGIITLNNSCGKKYDKFTIEFISNEKIIILNNEDFNLDRNKQDLLFIHINNKEKMQSIKKIISCRIVIYSEKKYQAKGIDLMSSIKPKKCDFFFTENISRNINIRDNIITLYPCTTR